MKRLIGRGLLLLLAVALTCAAVLALMPQPDNTFFAAAADKWAAAEAADPPKILIVGGSNTVFGLDSRAIAGATGRPVINLGLNAGLGLDYMLDEAARFVETGDVVVVSPEYEQFYGRTLWGSQQLVELAWLHPASLTLMTHPRQWAAIARGFPVVFQNRLRSVWLDLRSPGRDTFDEVYNRDAFNEYGDVVSHLGIDAERPVEEMNFLRDTTATFNRGAVRALRSFQERVAEKGARMVVLYPTIPAYHLERRREWIERVHQRLEAAEEVEVPAPPAAFAAPDEWFFDTAYHLSAEGRAARTRQLVELLAR